MRRVSFFALALLAAVAAVLLLASSHRSFAVAADSKAIECVACTILIKVVADLAAAHPTDVEHAVERACKLLPDKIQEPCVLFATLFEKEIIDMLERGETIDSVCLKLGACKNPQCRIFPHHQEPKPQSPKQQPSLVQMHAQRMHESKLQSWWKDWIKRIYDTFDKHVPLQDSDKDGMSPSNFGFRGTMWRGKDCDDSSSETYPGRRVDLKGQPQLDHNCNGIRGVNPATKQTYEQELCGATPPRGIAVLGDSAAAHFRLPEQWLNATAYSVDVFKPLLYVLENEFDWAHLSAYTGFGKDTTGLTPGPVDSIYMRMFQRNRCMHRDYQNIAVNGARSGAMRDIAKTLSRNQTADAPLTVFYSLIGNDVCSPHPTTDSFTKPEEFYRNVVEALDHLDKVLPQNSSIVFIGLVGGSILYDTLHDKKHPIGTTYANLYDYLNCMGLNPCWAWMQSNATIREMGDKHAALLSNIYPQVIKDKQAQYRNFRMYYHDFPVFDYLKKHPEIDITKMIEPVDGFHPSQALQPIIAKILWEDLLEKSPEVFGPVNPNNDRIMQLFGDQGGF